MFAAAAISAGHSLRDLSSLLVITAGERKGRRPSAATVMAILRVYDIKTRMDSAAVKPVVRRASSGLGTIGARRAGRTPVPVVSGR